MEVPRDVHSLSLKVLRLTRPSFSQQIPLNQNLTGSSHDLDTASASDTWDASFDQQFILSPVLTLPPAFGAAYVGETFSCALCANNELAVGSERNVSNVKIGAEMQAPLGNFPLDLCPDDENTAHFEILPGQSLQRIVQFDLREEGSHTLAVNVSYSETTATKGQSASSGRFRSFRKLYQFTARPCLNVRTKISSLEVDDQQEFHSLALEAQLDNVADESVVLKTVGFISKPAFKSTSLNWDAAPRTDAKSNCPILASRDVMQVAFLIEQQDEGPKRELTRDGRVILGQLNIHWRTSMGDAGYLSTGWLTTKRR